MTSRDERLRAILEPSTTAVLTMELQHGVVGRRRDARRARRRAAARGHARHRAPTLRRRARRRRTRGALHRRGAARRRRIHGELQDLRHVREAAARRRAPPPPTSASPGADLIDGLEDPRDIVVPRLHGMTPFTSTSLDQILRNLGVRTVVATGVSVNLGVFGMALTALDLGLPGGDPHRRRRRRSPRVRRRGAPAFTRPDRHAHDHRRTARALELTRTTERLHSRVGGVVR